VDREGEQGNGGSAAHESRAGEIRWLGSGGGDRGTRGVHRGTDDRKQKC
jgi:hypothetical protein